MAETKRKIRDTNIISIQELNAALNKKQKRSKHRNIITTVDGIKFHSKKEANRWGQLKLLVEKGKVSSLRRQVIYPIVWDGLLITRYIADFVYRDKDGVEIVEDVKGFRESTYRSKTTGKMVKRVNPAYAVFKMKKKMMKVAWKIDILET